MSGAPSSGKESGYPVRLSFSAVWEQPMVARQTRACGRLGDALRRVRSDEQRMLELDLVPKRTKV